MCYLPLHPPSASSFTSSFTFRRVSLCPAPLPSYSVPHHLLPVSLHSPLISCSLCLHQMVASMYLLAHCRQLGRRFEPEDERADPVMRILIPRHASALTCTRTRTGARRRVDAHSRALRKKKKRRRRSEFYRVTLLASSAACLMRAILKFCCSMKVELKWLCNFKVSLSLVADGLHTNVRGKEVAFCAGVNNRARVSAAPA